MISLDSLHLFKYCIDLAARHVHHYVLHTGKGSLALFLPAPVLILARLCSITTLKIA